PPASTRVLASGLCAALRVAKPANPRSITLFAHLSVGNGSTRVGVVFRYGQERGFLLRIMTDAFEYSPLLPTGSDETPYRLLTSDHVKVERALGHEFLQVAPEALRVLTREAMRDIAHLLRPGHLAQLRRIMDDPEASDNDRFVAL